MIAVRANDRYFTPEEYFAWEEQQLEKHELIDGRVYAMTGGTKNHNEIAPHLRGRGCKTYKFGGNGDRYLSQKRYGRMGNLELSFA
jgi:hypothetical protein